MVNAQYNTLSLGSAEKDEVVDRSKGAKLIVAALMLVGFAAVVTVGASSLAAGSAASSTDVEYNALDAAPVNCDKGSDGYNGDLPRWDPEYSTQEDFYNACYYSFRCCTTTGNGNGCYVSDNFGAMCRSCIKANGPRFVKKDCLDFIADTSGLDTSSFQLPELMADAGVPITQDPGYAVMFNNYPGAPTEESPRDTRSCWQGRGSGDPQVIDYAEKCFEVLSWCNLLCPRDTPQTVDHVMCKHCTLFGFEAGYWDIDNFKKAVAGIGQ